MAGIIKVYQEQLPASMLVGKVYHDCDRDAYGTFSEKWGEWFSGGWFETLEKATGAASDYVGAMRMNGDVFEYWIGILLPPDAAVPASYTGVPVAGGAFGAAWIKGKDDASLYGMHEACLDAFAKAGWQLAKDAWYIERYNCPRFTKPDQNGEVILDYLVSLA